MTPRYFALSEFDSPDEKGSGERYMDPDFIAALDHARGYAGFPLHITSGYRTKVHNLSVGGVGKSAHTRGYAADISTIGLGDAEVARLVAALTIAGIKRIGIAATFIHADNDPEKPSPAYWDYSDGKRHKA